MNKEITVYDIAIVGLNNDPINTFAVPQLMVSNYPGKEMHEVAVRYLTIQLQSSEDLTTKQNIYIKSKLIYN